MVVTGPFGLRPTEVLLHRICRDNDIVHRLTAPLEVWSGSQLIKDGGPIQRRAGAQEAGQQARRPQQ